MAAVNDFEREFARFLGRAPDVLRFAALGTTEQGDRGAALPGDCVQPSGAIGVYCPDWVVVQRDHSGDVNWIVETKGRVREGTGGEGRRNERVAPPMSAADGRTWRYLRVDRSHFHPDFATFRQLVVSVVSQRMFRERDLAPERTMTQAEIREARDDGRA